MAKDKSKGRVVVERNSDISEWGDKDVRGAYAGPLNIAGEMVDVDSLPALSENDRPGDAKAPVRS